MQENGYFFIIKTSIGKYLRKKRGQIYWGFVDFRKAFDFTDREPCGIKCENLGDTLCTNNIS
jgi:hypothetical protein